MIGGLLPIFGTSVLVAAAILLGVMALDTVSNPPAMPVIESDQTMADADQQRQREPAQRNPRADVYYDAITDRPLFLQNRRPRDLQVNDPEPVVPVAVTTEPEPLPEPPAVTMHGVITKNDEARALLGIDEADPEWIPIESDIKGWTLTEIGPDWVRLRRGDQSFKVDMY